MIVAILLAGGNGSRFGSEIPKQFQKLSSGRQIVDYSVGTFSTIDEIEKIILVGHPDWLEKLAKNYPNVTAIAGGKTRRESVRNGLFACPKDTQKVLIHDTARPFISSRIIQNCIDSLQENQAITVAIHVADTIVQTSHNEVVQIPNRENLRAEQTPQGFDFSIIMNAHRNFQGETTDDIRMVMALGVKPVIVSGDWKNFKITNKEDIAIANQIVEGKV